VLLRKLRCFPEAALNAPCPGYRSAGNGKPVAASREFLPLNGRGKETKKTADVTSAARAMGSGPGD